MPALGARFVVAEGTLGRTWERRNVTCLETASVCEAASNKSLKNLSEYEDFAGTAAILSRERAHFNRELMRSCKEFAYFCQERERSDQERECSGLELHHSV